MKHGLEFTAAQLEQLAIENETTDDLVASLERREISGSNELENIVQPNPAEEKQINKWGSINFDDLFRAGDY
jgi:hypothetical protein